MVSFNKMIIMRQQRLATSSGCLQWCYLMVLVLGVFCWQSINGQHDFQFDTNADDDLQVVFTEPMDVANNRPKITTYEQDISTCPSTDKKLILSLILRTNSWDDIVHTKKDRAIRKLANFFAIPKEYIMTDNVYKRTIQEMNKHVITKGINRLGTYKKLGQIALTIGCGEKYFSTGQLVANQIAQQMNDGSINDISGLDFGWWLIWQKPISNRTPRNRRDTAAEGSGEDDDYYYDDSDDDEGSITEVPTVNKNVDEHPHRHHHGDDKPTNIDRDSNSLKLTDKVLNTVDDSKIINIKPIIDPEIQKSVSQLESDITKTIENNNSKLKEIDLILKGKSTSMNPLMTIGTYIDSDEIGRMPDDLSIDEDTDTSDQDYVIEDVATVKKSNEIVEKSTEQYTESHEIVKITESILQTTPSTTTILTTTPTVIGLPVKSVNDINDITTIIDIDIPETTTVSTVEPMLVTKVSTTPKSETEETPTPTQTTPSTSEDVHAKISKTTTPEMLPITTEPNLIVVTERKVENTVPTSTTRTARIEPISSTPRNELTTETEEYDETDYDDYEDEFKNLVRTTSTPTTEPTSPKIAIPITEAIQPSTTTIPAATTPSGMPTTTTERTTTTEFVEPEPVNYGPFIKNRLPKQPVTAGKPFSYIVPLDTFYDVEDGNNLKLTLLDKNDNPLKSNSWIQFNPDTREIYGLPLEDAVSKWQFKLKAMDSANESVVETVDITVQQHKAHRSANHEISIGIKLNEKFPSNIDWQIKLIRGIVEVLGDNSLSNVVVREVRHSIQDVNSATFIYTNETLPKDKCPEEKLDELFQRLTIESLTESVSPDMTVKSVSGKPIGPCLKVESPKSKLPKPTPHTTKNYPPVPRNQVDRVNATVGHLLVFKVPADTFYDPEDNTDLKLSLLSLDRSPLDPKHWLQFDSKNQEFYGIPMPSDVGQKEYLLVAEDREGLSATDALVVVVSSPQHREYNNIFEMTLGMPYDEFDNAAVQRRFIERVAQIFGDSTTSNIQVKGHHKIHQSGKTAINYYNTTLYRPHNVCPNDNIDHIKRVLVHADGSVRPRVRDAIGNEFDLLKVTFTPVGACSDVEDRIHHAAIPITPDDSSSSSFKDDYLLTFVLPAVIIVAMILLAAIIACVLHRRRMTGKMELGDEEERRSFRSKGIPVIFQDELDEKPEIGNKSPIILKDEKPPLLPPSYNSTNPEDHEDMDEYVPPPAVVINGRESRGKSPVTPSYRKPPPYVSP